jgi:hypothetical protein
MYLGDVLLKPARVDVFVDWVVVAAAVDESRVTHTDR